MQSECQRICREASTWQSNLLSLYNSIEDVAAAFTEEDWDLSYSCAAVSTGEADYCNKSHSSPYSHALRLLYIFNKLFLFPWINKSDRLIKVTPFTHWRESYFLLQRPIP